MSRSSARRLIAPSTFVRTVRRYALLGKIRRQCATHGSPPSFASRDRNSPPRSEGAGVDFLSNSWVLYCLLTARQKAYDREAQSPAFSDNPLRTNTAALRAVTVSTYIVRFVPKMAEFSAAGRSQLRDDQEFLEFEAQGDNLFAERSQVVLVAVRGLFEEPVGPKATEDSRHLAAAVLREPSA